MVSKIQLTTEQKHHIASVIDQLESNSNRSNAEEMALNVLKAVLPERLPTRTQLLSNYPNPFNPETWIPYQRNQASEVSLSVYSSECKLVRQIDLGLKPAGNYQTTERALYWDGRNANGEQVSSGLYFYRLEAGDYSQTRQMVILK